MKKSRLQISLYILKAILVVVALCSTIMMSKQVSKPWDDRINIDLPSNDHWMNSNNIIQQSSKNNSYRLAYEESFGFFTDITDENWKLAQKLHAKIFPNTFTRDAQQFTRIKEEASRWYAENFHVEFHCPYALRIPTTGHMDGPKWVCDPHRIAEQQRQRSSNENDNNRCLVYSVGSNFNVQFENGVIDEISSDCEIHTFDIKKGGLLADALKNETLTFHPWGIGTPEQSEETKKQNDTLRDFKTLPETIHELGHADRTIDILKIDCEGCEWDTYKTWFESGADIRQILVEVHNSPFPKARDFFHNLHDMGYVIFSKEVQNGQCFEYGFLKLKPSFFVNNTNYRSYMDTR